MGMRMNGISFFSIYLVFNYEEICFHSHIDRLIDLMYNILNILLYYE